MPVKPLTPEEARRRIWLSWCAVWAYLLGVLIGTTCAYLLAVGAPWWRQKIMPDDNSTRWWADKRFALFVASVLGISLLSMWAIQYAHHAA